MQNEADQLRNDAEVVFVTLQNEFSFGGYLPDIQGSFGGASLSAPPSAEGWMLEAFREAMCGVGHASPNPAVGCVLVREGLELARGHTQAFGDAHAERSVVEKLGMARIPEGVDVFVTLEPCCHWGKTPPCTELFHSGLGRVHIGTLDPHPLVSGKGLEQLRSLGLEVDVGILGAESRAFLLPFLIQASKRLRPFIGLKWAQSIDGRLADHGGVSQWLTGPETARYTHWLRQKYDVIAVGWNTLLADVPQLTVRELPVGGVPEDPVRLCLDPKGRFLELEPGERLELSRRMRSGGWSLICGVSDAASSYDVRWGRDSPEDFGDPEIFSCLVRVPLKEFQDGFFEWLGSSDAASLRTGRCLQSVLIEGGAGVLDLFLSSGKYDMLHVFTSSVLLGGQNTRHGIARSSGLGFPFCLGRDAPRHHLLQSWKSGNDVLAEWVPEEIAGLVQSCR